MEGLPLPLPGLSHSSFVISHGAKFLQKQLFREGTFFLGGGGKGRGFRGRVINESEHQKGRVIPLCKLFKGRVTHLLQNFLMRIFVM